MSNRQAVSRMSPGQGLLLQLPGRVSEQVFGGQNGGDVTVRRVTIPDDTAASRGFHVHQGSDEYLCILEGQGTVQTPESRTSIAPGDVVHIPSGLPHMTVPDTNTTLRLLAFFPHPDIASITIEMPGPG